LRTCAGESVATAAATIVNLLRVFSRFQTVSSAAKSEGERADQNATQITLPRSPSSTSGSEVAGSRSRSGGETVPTAGGSIGGPGPKRSQAVQPSATVVTATIAALNQSIRQRARASSTRVTS
jgi:hypothetical protein